MAESRKRTRPNAKTRQRQRKSFQPALPAEMQAATGQPDADDALSDQQLLARWRARVAHARRLRRDWETTFQVETLERMYLGEQTDLGSDDRSGIWLNHFAATLSTQRPALLPTRLAFVVDPKAGTPQHDRLNARALGGVLDTLAAQDNHLMKSLRLAATQAFFRLGVLKSCYDPRMEDNPRAGEPLLNDADEALVGADGRKLTEPDQVLTDEVYRWLWVNAKNLLLPDEGPDTTRWTWIGEEIEVSLDQAQDDPTFPAEKRALLRANGRRDDWGETAPASDDTEAERERQMLRYTECWDIGEHRRYVWADGQSFDGFLVNEATQDGIEDHPYALLLPIPIAAPKPSPWPKPLCFDWLPIQQQYNLLRVQQIEAGKRAARKVVYDENTFPDSDEAQKFLASSADMQAVKVNDIARPPLVIGDGAQSIDVTRNIPFLLADWQRVTGASGTRLGDPDADTATEAVLTEQSASVRDSELRTLVSEWLTDAGRKMLQLVKQTLTLDLWIQLKEFGNDDIQEFLQSPGLQAYLALRVGPQNVQPLLQLMRVVPGMAEQLKQRFGQLKPLRVSRSMLTMEADVSVQPSTIRPVYRAQLLQLVQLLGPAALLSPTLLEELLHSFELPQGDRISEEILANLQHQQQLQQLPRGGQPAPGGPQPSSAASPLGTQSPLAAAAQGAGL